MWTYKILSAEDAVFYLPSSAQTIGAYEAEMQSLIGDSGIWAYAGSDSDDVFNVKDTTGTVPRLNVAVMLREPARLLQYYI